jgi:hypothetical protein
MNGFGFIQNPILTRAQSERTAAAPASELSRPIFVFRAGRNQLLTERHDPVLDRHARRRRPRLRPFYRPVALAADAASGALVATLLRSRRSAVPTISSVRHVVVHSRAEWLASHPHRRGLKTLVADAVAVEPVVGLGHELAAYGHCFREGSVISY